MKNRGAVAIRWPALLLGLLLLSANPALAHKGGDSHLRLRQGVSGGLQGHWLVNLRDLEQRIGIDQNRDAALTWGELRQQQDAAIALLQTSATFSAENAACTLQLGPIDDVETLADGVYARFPLQVSCADGRAADRLDYRLMFTEDPGHRALVQLHGPAGDQLSVLGPDHPGMALPASGGLPTGRTDGTGTTRFISEGVQHIWAGHDHLLFLAALILPLALGSPAGGARPAVRTTALAVLRLVTAFTLAHSLTLIAVPLSGLHLPMAPVEALIALSVALAGVNLAFPWFREGAWKVAFGFGLVHGLGFASVFGDLAVEQTLRVTALLWFNLGVELGQLTLMAIALPLLWLIAGRPPAARAISSTAAILITCAGLYWAAERVGPMV